jgi:hypothetical protein
MSSMPTGVAMNPMLVAESPILRWMWPLRQPGRAVPSAGWK